jgi:hypothetical protein
MDTFAFKETACFVRDFLICLSLLYGIDLAAAKLVLENINSYERLVRYSLAGKRSAGLETLTLINIILLLGTSCGVALLLVHVVHVCRLLYL